MRVVRPLLVVLVATAALGILPAGALAKTLRDTDGDVDAAFTYTKVKGAFLYKNQRVKIERGGALLLSVPVKGFGPGGFEGEKTVDAVDLDGDKEPEVVLNLFSGGAHCCTSAYVYRYRPSDNSYVRTVGFFGDFGFRLGNLDSKGPPEFLSADPAFSAAFTSYAETRFPIQVKRFARGRFQTVTSSFPRLVRRDLAGHKRAYPRYRRRKADVRGVLAAIAADQYTLGARSAGAATLEKAGRVYGASFARALERFLKRNGYDV